MNSIRIQRVWRFMFCVIVLPAALMLSVSCSGLRSGRPGWEPPQLVSVQGAGITPAYWYGYEKVHIPAEENREFSVVMRNDELLFALADELFLVPYRISNGQSLIFRERSSFRDQQQDSYLGPRPGRRMGLDTERISGGT